MATSLLVLGTFQFENFQMWLSATHNIGRVVNISLSSCLYWDTTLNSYKYLKDDDLGNAQINKAFSVNKKMIKNCLILDIEIKNRSWIVVAGCGLHYFVSARFVSFWVFVSFSTTERLKYLFSTAMEIHTMTCTVKKQNNFIFRLLVT